MKELERIMKVAVNAAKEAGRYAAEHITKLKEITRKEGISNLVTDVDKKCEEMVINKIFEEFPSHSILAEETGEYNSGSAFQWVVDPLDGTTNYAHGFPVFCTSIGVVSTGSVKIGVVYDPARDELFTAMDGKGAFLNGEKIRVSKIGTLQDSLIATGFAYDAKGKIANIEYFRAVLNKAQAVRRAGSAAIDLCYVACGRFDGFWEFGLSPWDTAAGQLIVREADGMVTTLNRGNFDISNKEIVATNGIVHDELLGLFGILPNSMRTL